MRLNIENTLIQDNLYPLAGYREKDVESKFVSVMKPIEQDVLQIESALLLHNIPLYAALAAGFFFYFLVAYLLSKTTFPSLVSAVILVPTFHLFYCLGGMNLLRKLYLKTLPELANDNKRRVRSLEEIVSYIAQPMKWGWRLAFFVYRTFLCPNVVDTSALIIATIILGYIFKLINFFLLMLIIVVLILVLPAVFTMTPAGDFLEKYINDLKAKKSEKKEEPKAEEKKEEPKAEEKKEEPKSEEKKEEEPKAEENNEEQKPEEEHKEENQ
ncbi:hypothetical protein GPJ56_009497 [Histomonas meleagridis]|uniref:uncharacterized protein n=1 Tax=Histomonas meleagridis TaxID=135588 RepID=UPI00355A8435|nr:hypothetical protein GPJ56_009497 [Histomonas meleagridis]KAH0804638.1 hypothetical protein GO595_002574 [Histomonas meleagridis]